MKALYRLCQSDNKVWQEFSEGTHNDTVAQEGYFQTISDFLINYVLKSEKEQRGENDLDV
jgi:abhydrolase domain-containing protein 13